MTEKNMVPEAEILDSDECWKLLEHTSVGRLGVIVDGQPDVFPVSFKVDGEGLVFRTGSGTKLQAIEANSMVALEADSVSAEFGLAWSVVVKGKAVQDDATGPALNEPRRGLFPWQGVGQDHLIRVVPQSVTGRRFTLSATGTWQTPLNEATRAGLEQSLPGPVEGDEPRTVEPWTVERFFEGSSRAYDIYLGAERMASGMGPVEVRVSKSQVSFRRRRGFAYLWRPAAYVKSVVPVVLSLALPFQAASPRFKQIAHPSPNIWMHHLELLDSSQLDAEVEQWMRQAYESAA